VPDTAEDLHLDGELHLRLGRHRLEPLHRDLNTYRTLYLSLGNQDAPTPPMSTNELHELNYDM
jgi:hypothetical protein